jgi:D-threo-aldose 1-dehydrogenase
VDPEVDEGRLLFSWRDRFRELCNEHGVEPGDACMHFGLSHPAIVSIALNTSKPEKMHRNVEILSTEIPAVFWEQMRKKGLLI